MAASETIRLDVVKTMKSDHRLAVTLDVSAVPYGRGVSRYTSNLARELAARPDVDLHLWGTSWGQYSQLQQWVAEFGSHVHKHVWRLPPSLIKRSWRKMNWPVAEQMTAGVQVFHAWDWQIPPVSNTPQVVTIHDLAYRLFPETAHPQVKAQYDWLLDEAEKRSDLHIIAVSHATKSDIVNLTAIPPERITVVYEALPQEAAIVPSEEEQQNVLQQRTLQKPFLLAVGTTEPRKNLRRVIEAWRPWKNELDLVIAGAAGWDNLPQEEGIRYLGYVTPVELASLYRKARALVYVSLYEGFGLPLLEAYFHQCPVITSALSSMSEIAGPAAVLVDPYDVEGISAAIGNMQSLSDAARRIQQSQMRETLGNFSWQRAAEETVRVYRKVL